MALRQLAQQLCLHSRFFHTALFYLLLEPDELKFLLERGVLLCDTRVRLAREPGAKPLEHTADLLASSLWLGSHQGLDSGIVHYEIPSRLLRSKDCCLGGFKMLPIPCKNGA